MKIQLFKLTLEIRYSERTIEQYRDPTAVSEAQYVLSLRSRALVYLTVTGVWDFCTAKLDLPFRRYRIVDTTSFGTKLGKISQGICLRLLWFARDVNKSSLEAQLWNAVPLFVREFLCARFGHREYGYERGGPETGPLGVYFYCLRCGELLEYDERVERYISYSEYQALQAEQCPS